MGKQKGQYFVGKIGNVSYYLWKDIPCMRTIPDEVHQCAIVRNNSKTNGASTRMGSSLRSLFAGALPFPRNFDMQTRFRGALRNWLKYAAQPSQPPNKLPYLDQFSFNEAALLQRICKIPLTLIQPQPDELVLQIPSFIPAKAIAAPEEVTHMQMTIIAACCDITTALPVGKTETVLTIPYDNTVQVAQEISLPLQMPLNSLTLVLVAFEFFKDGPANVNVRDERWLPVQVVGGVARV